MHFTEEQWDTAYIWLCKQRRNYPVNSDICHLRFNWNKENSQLVNELRSGRFQFSPMQSVAGYQRTCNYKQSL